MKANNIKNLITATVVVAGLYAMTAVAVPINITVDALSTVSPYLYPNGLATKSVYEGITGSPDNSPATNLKFLEKEIENYNAKNNPDLSEFGLSLALNEEEVSKFTTATDKKTFQVDFSGKYDYVVFHIGDYYEAMYLGSLEISGHNFDVPGVPNGNSTQTIYHTISSARFYNLGNVPDAGTTAFALCAALMGLGIMRRRI